MMCEVFGQSWRGHHQSINVAQPSLQVTHDILGHLSLQGTTSRQVHQVIAELENLKGTRKNLQPPHGLQALFINIALQDDSVWIIAFKVSDLKHAR
ncbi:hypothetical protein D3C77_164650 [compost metagenome]